MADDRKKKIDDLSPFPAIFLGAVAARNLAARGDDRPLKAMDLAETLRRKGASEATIYAETNKILDGSPYAGVSYGADGKPRFELTDHESRLRPGALDRSGHGLQGEVLTHPKLYDAMPEARYLEVQKGGQGSGGYTGDKVLIGDQHFARQMLLGRPQAKPTARGVNLHELQHHVQEVEGFAPGGSPRDFERQFPGDKNEATRRGIYKALAGEVEAENTRERANLTAKERREIPPASTAKLKRSEQIVTDQHGAIQEKFGGDLPKGYTVEAEINTRMRQANYTIWHKAGPLSRRKQVGTAYVRDTPNGPQVGRISINDKHQRKGIATALYARIEQDHGNRPVIPDATLSPKAAAFWRKHKPEALVDHTDIGDGSLMLDPMKAIRREAERMKSGGRIQEMADDPIRDFGEKIGGARKDRAAKTGPRPKTEGPADTRPGWQRRFVAAQKLSGGEPSGEWVLLDTRKTSRFGNPPASRMTFPSKEAAERAIPLIAVSQKHTVREVSERMPDGSWKTSGYAIWRKVGDKRVVKAVAETFPTRDAALLHMAANAERLMGSAKGYGEEILARPEKVVRTGPDWRAGDVMPERMMADLKARGVEFGHWQGDRQKVVNMAYDAMRDLSDVTGVAPESLSLQQRLGLAFGARGHGGKQGGAAHYERTYAAINLTREKGAGHLAHEWMHALDHYLGTVDDPKLGEFTVNAKGEKVLKAQGRETDYASHRVAGRTKGQLPDAVRQAYADLMNAMLQKPEQVTVESSRYERQAAAAREALKGEIASIRQGLEQKLTYGKRFTAPATAEQLARFDQAAEKIFAGELAVEWKPANPDVRLGARGSMAFRWTGPQVDALSNVMKEVRGRAGFDGQNHTGPMDRVAQAMRRVAQADKLAADMKATPTQTVMRATDYAREAARIDQTRTNPYWSTKHEMVARAFSAYVEDKLAAQGRSSNYLAFGSDNAFYKPFGVNPFPEGAERAAINQKFDNLFKAMRETGLVKPAVASSAPPAGAPFGTATAAEAMKAAKGQETSGLRGTQNPENLKAILDNRTAAAEPKVQTLEQFAKERGLTTTADVQSHIHGNLRSKPTSKSHQKRFDRELARLQDARDATTKAYQDAVARGEIRDLTADERLVKTATGHPDNPSTQAAKRVMEKRARRAASVTDTTPSVTDGGQKSVMNQRKAPASVTRAAPVRDVRPKPEAAEAKPVAPAPTKQTVATLRAEAKAAGIKGVSKMTKSALLKALDKTGAIAMVAAPAVAGLVAFDAARSEAKAAGATDSQARMQGLAQGAVAATATGGVMYAIGKGAALGLKALAKVAPAAAGPAGVGLALGLTGLAAYKAYQSHGAKGAALSLVGAEGLMELGKAPQPQAPTQGRLTTEQADVYAAAAKRYAAMKAAAQSEPEKRPKGWSNAARIAAAKARGAEVPYGGHAEQGPPQWAPSVSTTDVAAAMKKAS